MSNTLKSAAESTVHAVSDALSELVEGARDRIEDLPPLARTRHKRRTTRWTLIAVMAALGLFLFAAKRLRHDQSSSSTDSAGAVVAEKTLAVS